MATALTLGHYLLEKEIGSGGMGVVYAATDEALGRRVAIKVLRDGALADESHRRRFRREARAASALEHPNIVTIHEIGSSGREDFIVMELLEGTTLRRAIPPEGYPPEDALRLALEIASATAAAHEAGIVHRDIKPANIILTADGRTKLADFGLAKVFLEWSEEASTASALTAEKILIGTPGYASPEQIRGGTVDARTDVFALGCVLYEMLTGTRAFEPRPGQSGFAAVLENEPTAPRALRKRVPRDLERIVLRAIEKRPEDRYPSASEMLAELEAVRARLAARKVSLVQALQRPRVALAAALILIVVAVAAALARRELRNDRWVDEVALPKAAAHMQNAETVAAFRLLRRAAELKRDDARVLEELNRSSALVSFETSPEGADVSMRAFLDPPDAWERLGRTPLEARVPTGTEMVLLRVARDGYAERIFVGTGNVRKWSLPLTPLADARPDMVFVPGRRQAFFDAEASVEDFWIDRLEVTNREFQRFVRDRGYEKDELWEGAPRELRRRFVDRTGRPGPSTWAVGAPPEGEDDLPVGGVSWYEARAYCRSAGKDLPTFFHWQAAANFTFTTQWAGLSRFNADRAAPVGHPHRINGWGTYDMAGNVREWALNESAPGHRAALGGSWGEPSYTFSEPAFEPAESRQPHLGFRCAAFAAPRDEAALAPVRMPFRDFRKETPVGEEAFAVIRGLYDYPAKPLEARTEAVDERSPHYRLERVSFTAAYGNARKRALVLLPRNAPPPFQAVILFPGSGPFVARQDLALDGSTALTVFLSQSGRALVLPEYEGAYTRARGITFDGPGLHELMLPAAKDLRRTIDYLETRRDIDTRNLGYWGLSLGAGFGPLMSAVEPRLRAAVLVAGGLYHFRQPPEIDVINFAPRAHAATLMINGRHDYAFNLETSQKPLFELLGTDRKRHAVFESGHIPSEWHEVVRETLDWYDHHLGPVRVH